jgi:hypothetical protein
MSKSIFCLERFFFFLQFVTKPCTSPCWTVVIYLKVYIVDDIWKDCWQMKRYGIFNNFVMS